jgi:D-glycerate 3-kinase
MLRRMSNLTSATQVGLVSALLIDTIERRRAGPVPLLGLSAAQGAGKSTLCAALKHDLAARGYRLAVLALDDFYLTRAARSALASTVHPLLGTRGVPGTHDVALLDRVVGALAEAGADSETTWPIFDKALDDRVSPQSCQHWRDRPDLILLEGWCVGIPPEPEARLATALNALEREHDADGRWRRWVNRQLGGAYANLWARCERLIALIAPDFETILAWRSQQEQGLVTREGPGRLTDRTAVAGFIAHYERLTRWGFESLPARADLTLWLDRERRVSRHAQRAAAA